MEYTSRKSLIYKTRVEYGDYTLNHIEGCAHSCQYPCYAMLMAKRFGKIQSEEEWKEPKIVKNTIELLHKELPTLRDKIDNLHLCFTTDPFMYNFQEITDLSLEVIKIVNSYNVKCSVLTKGLLPKKLEEMRIDNRYGITLISLDEAFREKMEPYAAPYQERINSLKYLKQKGFFTWVSIEPYPTPNIIDQSLQKILESIYFVDKIIFGRLNYNKLVSSYPDSKKFFNNSADQVIKFCENNGIEYHIKNGTVTIEQKLT